MRPRQFIFTAAVAILALTAPRASALFAMPGEVPVDRLIKNVTAYVKAHPKQASGYYTLARLNYLALSMKSKTVRAFESGSEKKLPSISDLFQSPGKEAPDENQLKTYLADASANFVKALAMDAKNPLYHLTFASFMEAATHTNFDLGPVPGTTDAKDAPTGKDAWTDAAIEEYYKAYQLGIEADKARDLPATGVQSLVSYEAGERFITLVRARGPRDGDAQRIATVQAGQKTLSEKRQLVVTPIVFDLTGRAARLADLLDPHRTVTFDLDGTARGHKWPWVRSTTAILVWDPTHTGHIESGRQLFGSVTWWIFWPDGYSALDALDDNRDGQLTGGELQGLAVWHDLNGNGVSEAGEVQPIESTDVHSLSTHPTAYDVTSPTNPTGLHLRDDRQLPTWDWIVQQSR